MSICKTVINYIENFFSYEEIFLQACRENNDEKIKYILSKQKKVNINEGVKICIENSCIESLEAILNISNEYVDMNTAIILACQKNKYLIIELLLKHKANPLIGLKYTNSVNITKLLNKYRYE